MTQRASRLVRRAVSAAALCLLLAAASDAAARKFQMSGEWILRYGQVFWPLQYAATSRDMSGNAIHASMGNLTGAFLFPNGPVQGLGGVTATGSAPASLRVPARRFAGSYSAGVALCGPSVVQITTMATVSGPHTPATLAAGGGPGSFTWCPGDPACVAGGGMRSTDPPQGAGARNGRVIYRAGAHQFGGVMRMLLGGGGVNTALFKAVPFQAAHRYFGPMGTLEPTGGAYATTRVRQEPHGFATQPTMAPPNCFFLILYPGPKVTTMGGHTTTATGPSVTFPGARTTATGFPFTTGSVFAQQTAGTGGQDFFSVMGSDARTALGAGNLSLVAGGLSQRTTAPTTPYASFAKVRMTLSAPVPSLSPSGVAAAGALVLLAAGWALRARTRRSR